MLPIVLLLFHIPHIRANFHMYAFFPLLCALCIKRKNKHFYLDYFLTAKQPHSSILNPRFLFFYSQMQMAHHKTQFAPEIPLKSVLLLMRNDAIKS